MKHVVYSAELVEPTPTRERRVKVTNRFTGAKFYRPYPESEMGLSDKVRAIYTSPLVKVRIIWYDIPLEMLFFETFEGIENGVPAPDQSTSV